MTTEPKLLYQNVDYVLENVEYITDNEKELRTGEQGEKRAKRVFSTELMKYCDDVSEQPFSTHPGAGTITQKILSALLVICVILFAIAVGSGSILPSSISIILNLGAFAVFAHKFIFDGTKLDKITPKKMSANILGRRYPHGKSHKRVCIVTHTDAPLTPRSFIFGASAAYILSLCSIIGNTVLFLSNLLFLFCGAPIDSEFFFALRIISFIFLPFYIFGIVFINPKKASSGVSSSLVPSSIAVSIFKQFSEDSFRYSNTEICCLITGSEYSSHAGSYAFIKKYRRVFSDIPTVFIPVDEITNSERLSVFFKDGSGNKGSAEIASIIAQAAENLELKLTKESTLLGTASFTPFAVNKFPACSLGTSKKHTSKTLSATADTVNTVRRKAIEDVGALIIETLNYYDS